MKKFLMVSLFALALISMSNFGKAYAQVVPGNPDYVQVSVTTNTQVLAFDGSRIDWTFHPRNGAVNCIEGFTNGQVSLQTPTTTFGLEFTNGSYLTENVTPQVSVNCTSETGTVTLDIFIHHKI